MRRVAIALAGLLTGFVLTLGVNAWAAPYASRQVAGFGGGTLTSALTRYAATVTLGGADQASATQITADIIYVTGSGGAKLPSATAGLQVTVINDGTGTLTLYPKDGASDKFQGGSANTGIGFGSSAIYIFASCAKAGVWTLAIVPFLNVSTGSFLTWNIGNVAISGNINMGVATTINAVNIAATAPIAYSVTTGITASGTHTQVGATATTKEINEVTTAAGASDAIKAIAAAAGLHQVFVNKGASAVALWPASGDQMCFSGSACDSVDAVMSTTIGINVAIQCWAKDATTWYCK